MNLIRLKKFVSCIDCGDTQICREEIEISNFGLSSPEIRVHANGTRWESRAFVCGKIVKWIPNYMSEEWCGECKVSAKYKEKERKIASIREKISSLEKELRNVEKTS